MRTLGKEFNEAYNFKRLLQTTPELAQRYKKHDDAINSVVPTKHISLKDYTSPIFCPINSATGPNDTVNMNIFGPGQADWPRRVRYAEQIPELRSRNYVVWVVKIVDRVIGSRLNAQYEIQAEVVRVSRPTIVTYWPDTEQGRIPRASHRPVDTKKLDRIDEQKFSAYFLSDSRDQKFPHGLQQCGIIPNEHLYFNATFYDYDVANLYANSLRHQLRTAAQI